MTSTTQASVRGYPWQVPSSALVVGYARTGEAVARVLHERGCDVVVVDDRAPVTVIEAAGAAGVELVAAPDLAQLRGLAREVDLIVMSPGVPPSHAIFSVAPADKIVSEIELAYRLASMPIVAVTGTNGKTTVTTLVAQMLVRSGLAASAVGNIGPTLIEAVVADNLDIAVAECSSFQLALCDTFRPSVGTWLNLAEDHLDWHRDLEDYEAAKARIWRSQEPEDVAVANAADPVVIANARGALSRLVTFGDEGDYRVADDHFRGPRGEDLGAIELLGRRLPHDLENAVAALATALEAGATAEGCAIALRESTVLPHRVELVDEIDGIEFYDDSKATTPSAVIAALRAFRSAVLIAGGRNKGLDLSVVGAYVDATPGLQLRGVVAIGEAGDEVEAIFARRTDVERASTMDVAVAAAFSLARPGDAVLLSPGCASFDWYRSYEERGRAFSEAVRALRLLRARDGGRK